MRYSRCAICGKTVTSRFWVCAKCENQYGLNGARSTWPEWAQYLAGEEQRARRPRKDIAGIVNKETDILLYGELNDDGALGETDIEIRGRRTVD